MIWRGKRTMGGQLKLWRKSIEIWLLVSGERLDQVARAVGASRGVSECRRQRGEIMPAN
jgi:hypothetical protein